jgi:hypothetical protein
MNKRVAERGRKASRYRNPSFHSLYDKGEDVNNIVVYTVNQES